MSTNKLSIEAAAASETFSHDRRLSSSCTDHNSPLDGDSTHRSLATFRPVVPAFRASSRLEMPFLPPPLPEPPDWMHSYEESKYHPLRLFPVPVQMSDNAYWWIDEMNDAVINMPVASACDEAVELVESEVSDESIKDCKNSATSNDVDATINYEILGAYNSVSRQEPSNEDDFAAFAQLHERMTELSESDSSHDSPPTVCPDESPQIKNNNSRNIRRTAVGITGGTLAATGLALELLPVVPGFLVTYYGLVVLASEFESARELLATVRRPIEKWLADDDYETREWNPYELVVWEEVIGYNSSDYCWNKNEIDGEFSTLMKSAEMLNTFAEIDDGNSNDGSFSEKQSNNNPWKPMLRRVLMIETPRNSDGDDHD